MLATITNNQDIILSQITAWEEEAVDKHFSATAPHQRYIVDSVSQRWDGVFRKYNKKSHRLARPLLAELRKLANDKGFVLDAMDARPPTSVELNTDITADMLTGITLLEFQIEAIKKVTSAEVGIFDIGTGGGKTEVMAGICKVIPCQTVIITEMTIIVDQIKARLMLRDICDEPGLFYAGRRPNGELIVIGCIQSLCPPTMPSPPERSKCQSEETYGRAVKAYPKKLQAYKTRLANKKYLDSVVAQSNMILVDECDTAVSSTWKDVFRYRFKGRYRYGFSGTPFDKQRPVEKLVLQEHLGSVIFRHDKHAVQADGLTVPLEYYMIVFGEWDNRNESSAYDIAVNDHIVYCERFHRMVARICAKYPDDGTMILVDRDDLGYALIEACKELGIRAEFCHGKTAKKNKKRIIEDFESRELKVLIGGKNVRRGLDLKGGCENLIVATGGQLESEFDQRLGRARRLNKRGVARVFDFMFAGNKYLYKHSRERLKAIVGMGYKSTVIFADAAVDGDKFVRSRFRKPVKH